MQRAYYITPDWDAILQVESVVINDQVLGDSPLVFFYLAEAYRHTGNPAEAVRRYTTAIGLDGAFAPAFWGRALAHLAQNRRNDALADFDRALNADPAFIPTYLDRAAYLAASGDLAAAIDDLEQARLVAPGSALVLARLALAYLDAARLPAAAEAARAALDLDPGLALAYYARGRIAYAQEDLAAAQADLSISYRYVLPLDHPVPGQWQAGVLLATALAELGIGQPSAALPLLTQAAALDPSNPGIFLARAGLHLSRSSFEDARADYVAAINLLEDAARPGPDLPLAHIGLGQSLLGLDRPDAALTAFQAALRLAPQTFAAQLGLGQALLGMGRVADSIAAFTTALDLAATTAETIQVYAWRAQAHAAAGQPAAEAADWLAVASLGAATHPLVSTAEARLTAIGPLPTATLDPTAQAAATLTVQAKPATPTRTATATPTKLSTPTRTPTPNG
jgi:tetratricopeptide (TPR) repeat protein